jgi:hypothetical protein
MDANDQAPHMGDKERFCRSFEWGVNITWSGEQGILVLDKDQRPDYTGGIHAKRLGGPLRWYIGEPKTTKPFTGAIEAYIDVWR